MTFIWLPLQNISVAQSSRRPNTASEQVHVGAAANSSFLWKQSSALMMRMEDTNSISCYRNYFKSHVTSFFFFFFLCTVIRITFLHKIIPKYKSVYSKRRGGQIHGYSLCLKSFHLKLLQIMPSSDLTSAPQSLDHCLKLSVTVFFFPSLLLALFSCLLSHILLSNKKFYGD